MITYADACKLVLDYLGKLGCEARIVDAQTVEQDWGWVIYWDFQDTTRIPTKWSTRPRPPFFVDRVTSACIHVGNTGPKSALLRLFEARDTRLAKMQKEGKDPLEGTVLPPRPQIFVVHKLSDG